MPYRKKLQELLNEKKISGVFIFTSNGDIFWHTGTFPQADNKFIDGYKLLSDWMTYPSSITVAGVKYVSIMNAYPNYWVVTNPNNYGSLIFQHNSSLGYYFLCWLDSSQDPLEVQKEIKIMVDLFA